MAVDICENITREVTVKKILITGGAGYKGVILAGELLREGHKVTILDNFMYGYEPVIAVSSNKNCNIKKKDIRNLSKDDVKDYDIIYHLAAISGYPACEANPHSAQTINVTATNSLVKMLGDEQVIVYASTTSMYGKSGEAQDESSTPTPVSLYGITKYQAENICLQRKNCVVFRFATLFGISPKMRCDLLLNDFVYRAVYDRSILLFDAYSVRTFLHVRDAISAYLMVLHYPEMMGSIYNVGSNDMNYSKLDLAKKIKKHIDIEIIETKLEDPDRRNFVINFDKIRTLGFKPTISIDEGIGELLRLYSWYKPFSNYRTI